jgi:hypothetical protein
MIKYATLPKRLVRASTLYSEQELATRRLHPEDKLLEDGTPSKAPEQAWKNNPSALLEANTLGDVINIANKAVAIVHGLCVPPLITIDIDNLTKATIIKDIVDTLPDSQKPLLISKGIGKAGYHLLYHNTPDNKLLLDYCLGIHRGGIGDHLDLLQSEDKILFIGNKGNLTKEHIYLAETDDPDYKTDTLRPIPLILQLAVMALFKDSHPRELNIAKESGTYLPEHTNQRSELGYLFKDFNPLSPGYDITLATFIAKRAKADIKNNFSNQPEEEEYIYHPRYYTATPNDLLLRLSGSLKNDPGISQQQHKSILEAINNLLPHSKNYTDLQNEIITPDTREPYNYNKDWEDMTSSIYTIHNQILHLYRVSRHTSPDPHMVHNTETGEIRLFRSPGDLMEEISGESTLPRNILKKVQARAITVDLLERPDKPFGLLAPNKNSTHRRPTFNIYRRTKVQEMFYEPRETTLLTKHIYKYPSTIIGAIESQIGSAKTHQLFLPFIKHKLMTHQPSPLIFALMGPPHSFKTGLVEGVLKPLFSTSRYLKTSGDILTEKYNDYLVNLDILLVDEIHHLVGTPILKPLIQTLNKFGAEYHEGIRHMYSSVSKGKDVHQEVTPFVTMNKVVVPATETVGERRLVVGYSKQPVRDSLKMDDPDIKSAIREELIDFAYYLAMEVGEISSVDYGNNKNWKEVDDHYYKFMGEGVSKLKQFGMAIGMTNDEVNIPKLQELMTPNDITECVLRMQRTSHRSPYRLRLWNAKGSFNIETPGVADHIEDIDYNDIPKILVNNDNVLRPCIVGNGINQMKQDLVISEETLLKYNLIRPNGKLWSEEEEELLMNKGEAK